MVSAYYYTRVGSHQQSFPMQNRRKETVKYTKKKESEGNGCFYSRRPGKKKKHVILYTEDLVFIFLSLIDTYGRFDGGELKAINSMPPIFPPVSFI
jgi:hypothetical protein